MTKPCSNYAIYGGGSRLIIPHCLETVAKRVNVCLTASSTKSIRHLIFFTKWFYYYQIMPLVLIISGRRCRPIQLLPGSRLTSTKGRMILLLISLIVASLLLLIHTLSLLLLPPLPPTPPSPPSLSSLQETGLVEVKKEMSVELYDIDAIKSQLGDVLDDFIGDVRSAASPSFLSLLPLPVSIPPIPLSLLPLPPSSPPLPPSYPPLPPSYPPLPP